MQWNLKENLNKVHLFSEKLFLTQKYLLIKKKIRVSKEGFFAFGIDRDRKNDLTIRVYKESNGGRMSNMQ